MELSDQAPGGLQTEWVGVCAEMAYHKWRNQYYFSNSGTFKGPDAGTNVQIRATEHNNGSLIIRNNDNPDHWYVLIICEVFTFRIAGYIKGRDAQQGRFWKSPNNRPGAWFVPQSELIKIQSQAA